MKKIPIILSVIASFAIVSLIVHAPVYGYTIEYESIGYLLKEKPTICAYEPDDPDLSEREVKKLLEQTRIASLEWESHLQTAVNYQKDKEHWEIKYVKIDNDKIIDTTDCTINVIFEKIPDIPVLENRLLGVAKLDPISEVWTVTIYYLQTKLEYTTGYIGDQKYYWYEPYYTDQLRTSEELGTVIRHELGHALGLGHYQADNFEVNLEWAKGTKPSPSIMAPISSENAKGQSILPKDIDLMRVLYGENGFLPDSDVDDFSPFKARMFIEEKLFDEALSYVEEYEEPNTGEEILQYKAEAFWKLNRYLEAEKTADEILIINPENIDALYIKGKTLAKSEKYDESIDVFNELLELDPTHDAAISYKGKVFFDQNMDQEAVKYFVDSLEINPYNVDNLHRIGILLKNYERYDDAITFYDFALRVEPDRINVLNNKGNALYLLERFNEAIEYFDKVLDIDPHNEYALNKKGQTLETMGETEKAKELFDKLEKIKSGTLNLSAHSIKTQQMADMPEDNPIQKPNSTELQIPNWVRGNAKWWAQGAIGDSDFVSGIQYLIKEGIIHIPPTQQSTSLGPQEIPQWIKNNADWWSQGLILDDDFVKGIQYLVENGIIVV